MKFLLDTNFLTIPGQFKVDVFSELFRLGKVELYTLNLVVKELETIKSKHSKLGLELIKKNNVQVLHAEGNTDKEIIRAAKENNFVVCTQDKELISLLKKNNIKVVYLRQKKYLEMK